MLRWRAVSKMVSGNIARWIKGDFPPFLAYWGRERLPLLSAVYQNAPYCPRSAVLSLSICLSTSRVSTLANRTDEHCGINILQSIKSISGRSKSMAITWQRAMWNQTKPTKTWWFVWTPGFFYGFSYVDTLKSLYGSLYSAFYWRN